MTLSIDDPNALPPWGRMLHADTQASFLDRVPTDFRLLPGESHSDRIASWRRFRTATLESIKATLWPEYDYENRAWTGASAVHMRSLTRADHAVMDRIQYHPEGLEFYRPPRSPLRTADCPRHDQLFALEDNSEMEQFAASYRYYDRIVSEELSFETVETIRIQAMYAKVSNVSTQFKYFLQRPRPYQTALLLSIDDFRHQNARTAHSPAMCSAHSLQFVLAAGGMLERLWADNIIDSSSANSESVQALTQWAVDVGDRRVMAGVHYPSDNLCSWLIFLRLADRVYTNPNVKAALWSAITRQSYVYQEVRAATRGASDHPYHPILRELDQAAS